MRAILLLLSLLFYCFVHAQHELITIAIISNNRLDSLKRLCKSLDNTVNHSNRTLTLIFNLEASSSKDLLDFVYDFKWKFGDKFINMRIKQGGLITAVMESWYPRTNSDYGVFLEDDIEVSPLWLCWVEKALKAVNDGIFRKIQGRILGLSLYSPRITETVFPKPDFDSPAITQAISGDPMYPYAMQTPCSWGALFFPEQWREFFYYARHRISMDPVDHPVIIPKSRTNGWKGSWKKFMFEYMWYNGQFMLYPNFPHQHSFSTNHMEVGEHISLEIRTEKLKFTVPLLKDMEVLDSLKLSEDKPLAVLDLFGKHFWDNAILKRRLFARAFEDDGVSANKPSEIDSIKVGSMFLSSQNELFTSMVSSSGVFYQGIFQSDGNLVIYIQQEGSDKPTGVMWSTNTSSKSTSIFAVTPEGLSVSEENALLWSSPESQSVVATDSAVLRLESNGNLVFYKDETSNARCKREGAIWNSFESSGKKWRTPDRCKKAVKEFNAERLCKKIPIESIDFAASLHKKDGLTIMLATFSRYRLLWKQINYFSTSDLITSIVVVWHNIKISPPQSTIVRNTVIHFVQRDVDSLSNRFVPNMLVNTDAVLIIDDDMHVNVADIHLLYAVWKKFPRNIVGFFPRWVSDEPNGQLKYMYQSEEMGKKAGYAFMLTKVMMIHKDLLYSYTCDERMPVFHQMVDSYFNCEDLSMNGIAAFNPHKDMLNGSPPLFVSPLHSIMDFGKVGKSGLHLQKSHLDARTECVNQINDAYRNIHNEPWPLQTSVVKTAVSHDGDEEVVKLWVEPYSGKPDRNHVDCLSFVNSECVPRNNGVPRFVWDDVSSI